MKDRLDRMLVDTGNKSLNLFLKEEQFIKNTEKIIKEKLMPYLSNQFSVYGSKISSSLWSTLREDGFLNL